MSNIVQPVSPLAEFFAAQRGSSLWPDAGIRIGEIAFLGHLNLRGNPQDQHFLDAVRHALGLDLAVKPNTVAENQQARMLWMGPDEWLIQTPPHQESHIFHSLRDAFGSTFFALTDISDGQTVISLSGKHSVDMLSKGCPLDFHGSVFPSGSCAQSHIAKANVLIRAVEAESSFEITVRRSFAEYVALWLLDAAEEYGTAIL